MSGDYTRFTFDPRKRYSSVLMQQGRVQLDSDWNEEIDILRRRVRTFSIDALGPVGVPYLSLPDSFLLGLIAGPQPDLSIEPGRLYIQGLVAEAFADEGWTYRNQPFYPDPPDLPADGDAVAYLDVWDREVTYIEDPELLDEALGGVDTTTRMQTVWQLRVEERDGAQCGMDVGDPPSAGRLTTDAVAPPDPDDPCILPPVGGYRGLENRLYRVEVHDGGALGTARFKWSRDNASIVSAVNSIAVSGGQTTLQVNRFGRDEVMRFQIGNWVEVTDDHRELMGEPGEMAFIVDLDEANREIVLDRALPTGGGRAFGVDAEELLERHTRIKRWDQTAVTNTIDGDGLIDTGAGPIPIEDGIEINFSMDPAGGEFRVGDTWNFWARTATASIEILTDAPPRSIQHHYVQLAAITDLGGDNPQIHDCRPPQEERAGCCTFVVQRGESIQAAIDALPPQGGCICLKTGVHLITETLRIDRDHVYMHGESPGTIIRASGGVAPLLEIGVRSTGIRIAMIEFEAGRVEQPPQAVIMIRGAIDVVIEGCQIRTDFPQGFVGIRILRSDGVCIEKCLIESVNVGVWAEGFCRILTVINNEINLAMDPRDDRQGTNAGLIGVWARNIPSPVRINDNVILGAFIGVRLNDAMVGDAPRSLARGSSVTGNFVVCAQVSLNLDGDARIGAIDVASDESTVAHNKVFYGFLYYVGIHVTGSRCDVTANLTVALGQQPSVLGPIGIQIGDQSATNSDNPDENSNGVVLGAVVTGNIVSGLQHGILVMNADDVTVASNVVEAEEGALSFGIGLFQVRSGSVSDNRIRNGLAGVLGTRGRLNRVSNNTILNTGAGISLGAEWGPAVVENRIDRASIWGVLSLVMIGRCDVVGNRITSCGYARAVSFGIACAFQVGELHIESNEVMDTGFAAGEDSASSRAYGIYGELILEARVESNLVTYSTLNGLDPSREDRALRMRGILDRQLAIGATALTFGFPIQIMNNKFIGAGRSALVELAQASFPIGQQIIFIRFERVNFDHNYCNHFVASQDIQRTTVSLTGRQGIVMGNHIKSTVPISPSVDFNGMQGTFIGNVTVGGSNLNPDFPNTENQFNINA